MQTQFDDSEFVAISENEYVYICERQEPKDVSLYCQCGECGLCDRKEVERERIDIVVTDYDAYFYINFGRVSAISEQEGFYNIRNRKDLQEVFNKVVNKFTYWQQYKVDIFDKWSELEEYSKEFWNQLVNYIFSTKQNTVRIKQLDKNLPIVYKLDRNIKENDNTITEICGYCADIQDDISSPIQINNLEKRDIDNLKITVRHEEIHHLLKLMNINNSDDSAQFWILATVFDAHPYVALKDEDLRLFDLWQEYYAQVEDRLKQLITALAIVSGNAEEFYKKIECVCKEMTNIANLSQSPEALCG